MTPPKCRLCGKEHWPRTGCDWGPAIKAARKIIKAGGGEMPQPHPESVQALKAMAEKIKFKRAAKKKKTKAKGKKK